MVTPSSFSITSEPTGAGMITMTLAGELDLVARDSLRKAIDQAIWSERAAEIQVDLSGVTFVDSTMVGVLVRGRNAAMAAGSKLYVRNARGVVLSVLQMTGVLASLTPPASESV